MAYVLEPPRGGEIAGSGHGTVTSVRRLPWSWRRPSTTVHSAQGLWWRSRERRQGTRRTAAYGHRCPCLRGRGRHLCLRSPGRNGVTALRGTSQWNPGRVVLVQEPVAHDNTTTRYLLKKALLRKEEEEAARCPDPAPDADAVGPALRAHWRLFPVEEEKEEEEADASYLLSLSSRPLSSSTAAVAWLLCWFSWSSSSRFVPFGFWQARDALCIMADMNQKGFFMFVDIPFVPQRQILLVQTIQQTTEFLQLLYVSGGRCLCCAGRACHATLVSTTAVCAQGWLCWLRCASAVFLLVVAGQDLRHLGRYDQTDSCSGMYKAGIAVDIAPRAVFSSLFRRPMMRGIIAFTDQKDSCSDIYIAGIAGDNAPRAVFLGWQAHDIQHHGRYVPRRTVATWCHDCRKLRSLRSCSPSRSSSSLSFRRGRSPWSRLFSRPLCFTSCCSISGGRCPVVQFVQVHFPVVVQRQVPWSKLFV